MVGLARATPAPAAEVIPLTLTTTTTTRALLSRQLMDVVVIVCALVDL
jgi:hypothetical protein